MIDRDASFVYDLHKVSTGNIIANIEKDCLQDDDRRKAGTFE